MLRAHLLHIGGRGTSFAQDLCVQVKCLNCYVLKATTFKILVYQFNQCLFFLFVHQGFTFPADCKVGDWKPFGECSATCNGGTKTRAREVVEEPENGGAACPHLEETETCNTDQCKGILNPILCASIISHILFFGHSLFS